MALHKGVLQRHAIMLAPGVSEISFGLQVSDNVSGSLIGPRRMEGEKHSRITDVSVSDFCHEYQRQASPCLQKSCWEGSWASNSLQFGLPPENKLPHVWQSTAVRR